MLIADRKFLFTRALSGVTGQIMRAGCCRNSTQIVTDPSPDLPHPILVVEIPLHGFAQAALKRESGFPAEFSLNLGGVNRGNVMKSATRFWILDFGFNQKPRHASSR